MISNYKCIARNNVPNNKFTQTIDKHKYMQTIRSTCKQIYVCVVHVIKLFDVIIMAAR